MWTPGQKGTGAVYKAEGAELNDEDADLDEVIVKTKKLTRLAKVSNEQFNKPPTANQMATSFARDLVRKADAAYLGENTSPLIGLLHTAGAVDAPTPVTDSLDVLVDLLAELEVNGAEPSHIIVDPLSWAALRKFKTADTYNSTLLGAGTEDAKPRLLSLPVLRSRVRARPHRDRRGPQPDSHRCRPGEDRAERPRGVHLRQRGAARDVAYRLWCDPSAGTPGPVHRPRRRQLVKAGRCGTATSLGRCRTALLPAGSSKRLPFRSGPVGNTNHENGTAPMTAATQTSRRHRPRRCSNPPALTRRATHRPGPTRHRHRPRDRRRPPAAAVPRVCRRRLVVTA